MAETKYRAEPFFYSGPPLDPDEDAEEPYVWEIQESEDGKHWKPRGEAFESEYDAKYRVRELMG